MRRPSVADFEAAGADAFHQLRRRHRRLPTVSTVHTTAVLSFARRLPSALDFGPLYGWLAAFRPVLELEDSDRPYRLVKDPRRRRTTGSYVTPSVVVDYLVAETLGPLLPRESQKFLGLRILDPAVGAGCFL